MFQRPDVIFFFRAAVALLLGLSLGLERERSNSEEEHPHFAGIRTFPICALIGFLCATFDTAWLLPAGFLGMAAIATVAYYRSTHQGHQGVTTEAAFLLTFLLGAGAARGYVLESACVALAATSLLAWRDTLHGFARRLPARDLQAAVKFAVISVIILPLLPDRTFGSGWMSINVYKTWLMVVLISGIGFAGYILTRAVGPRAGTGLAGLVGGLVSSTAVTLMFSRRSREMPSLSAACALAIVAACTVLYARVFVEALVVNPRFALALAAPLATLFLFSLGACALLYRTAATETKTGETGVITYKNPVELIPAIKFALVYAAISMIFKLSQSKFGDTGAYVAAFLSGLTDMDAVTLSMAAMTKAGSMAMPAAVSSVLLAAVANTLVKLGIATFLASPTARRDVQLALGATCALAIGVLVWVRLAA